MLQHLILHKELMLSSKLPEYLWQKVGFDLFELKKVHYLLAVHALSKFQRCPLPVIYQFVNLSMIWVSVLSYVVATLE